MRILITGGSGFIGTHLVRRLMRHRGAIKNLDVRPPQDAKLHRFWTQCSLLDAGRLATEVASFLPTHVIHLAADANMEGRSIEDYPVNVQGMTNLLSALRQQRSLERLLVTSSQHVRRPGAGDTNDLRDYAPLMAYGQSKVVTEELTKAADLPCCWTIIRPTNVWGAGHPYLVDGLWRLIHRGIYFHPSVDRVVRGYGYVENVCWQVEGLLQALPEQIARRVFYVGDRNELQSEWIDAFGIELTGKRVRRAPYSAIKMLAAVGDIVLRFGGRFPMHSSRFSNLTTDNRVPMDAIHALLGDPPIAWRDGVRETCAKLKVHYAKVS